MFIYPIAYCWACCSKDRIAALEQHNQELLSHISNLASSEQSEANSHTGRGSVCIQVQYKHTYTYIHMYMRASETKANKNR